MPCLRPTTRPSHPGLVLMLLCFTACTAVAGEAYDFTAADKLAQSAITDGSTPSVAYAIARDGIILHEGVFGMADREAGRRATLRTAYPLASATKPITAAALMVLHERDGLDLGMPLREALPELQVRGEGAERITLAQLLSHTAGLGTYARIRYAAAVRSAPPLARDWAAHAYTVNEPGRISEYSNLGYGLLGEVLSRQARSSYADAVERLVFGPLGMDDAFIDVPRKDQTDVAVHYDASLVRLPPMRNNTPGAGNAHASARDLMKFAMLHAGATADSPLSPAGVAAMQARRGDAFHHYYGSAYYGLGWYVRQEGEQRVVWHEGGMPGASSIIKLLPDQRIAVVVLGNRTDANALNQAIADALVRAVLPEYSAQPLDPVAGYAPLAGQPGFAGTWRGAVMVEGTRVESTLELAADGAGTFRYQAPGQAPAESSVRAMVNGDSFISSLPGRLPSRDIAAADEPLLLLKLVRTGERFSGAVVAYSSLQRLEYLLPFPITLERQPAAPDAALSSKAGVPDAPVVDQRR
jgi:CubicO group peptidase (beta-lactamase class C family)